MMLVSMTMCMLAATAIENVRIEVGDGSIIEQGTVVFEGERIVSVGKGKPPKGAKVIDGRGKVLTPGLIEVQSRLGLTEVGLEDGGNDASHEREYRPAFHAGDGINVFSSRVPIARKGGVTTVIVSPAGGVISGTGTLVHLTGQLMDFSKSIAMFGQVGEYGASLSGGARPALWMNLRQLFADIDFYQKNKTRVLRGEAKELMLSPFQLEAMLPVSRGRLPLVLTANRATDIAMALRFAKEQRIKIIIRGGAEGWKVSKQLAARRVPVIVKPTSQMLTSFESIGARDDNPALLHKDGVPLIISGGDWDQNVRRLRQEAGLAVAWGLPRNDALKAITLTPAKAFGVDKELGSIRRGKLANLVLWSSDPLELRSRALRMWSRGKPRSLQTRQTLLAKRYLKRLPLSK